MNERFSQIKSDIIDGVDFNTEVNGANDRCVAVVNRAYLSGDFAFSFATSYSFKATKDFVITGIRTAIHNPDGTPAEVGDKTTVIYKVVQPIPLFQNMALAEQSGKPLNSGGGPKHE